MWQLIAQNKRRSAILVVAMLALMLTLGFAVGAALVPSVVTAVNEDGVSTVRFNPAGGAIGMVIAFIIWAIQALIAYFQGDRILLAVSGAQEIQKEDHPQLFNIVEEMVIASRLPKMPRVYIIDDMSPNAFATGRTPENSAVAVTAGLLSKLNRDELQGVIAHEVAHIVHRDVLFMTMVGIMVGTVVMISEVFLRSMWYSGGGGARHRGSSKKSGGQGQIVILVVAIVLAILAPMLAQVIYFAVSRQREYLADAGAAVYTRYPEGLASALEKISGSTRVLQRANRATAPMYIINPLHKPGKMALNLTRTHPPIQDRVRILRSLAGGVSYAKYQAAWGAVAGKSNAQIPAAALQEKVQPIREGNAKSEAVGRKKDTRERMRETSDLLRKLNGFLFLPCACGMQVKLPPDFPKEHIACPKCATRLQVPVAHLAALEGAGEILRAQSGAPSDIPMAKAKKARPVDMNTPLTVERRGRGWMSFKCPCGTTRSISPAYGGQNMQCKGCGRAIRVRDV